MRSAIQPRANSPVRQRVGPTVKALRQEQGISLNVLAMQAGISPSHLSRIERGLTVPSYDVLDRIADALGSDLGALRADEESARAIDGELAALFTDLGITDGAQAELLGLSHQTRAVLASALRRLQSRAADQGGTGAETGPSDGAGSHGGLTAIAPLGQVAQGLS